MHDLSYLCYGEHTRNSGFVDPNPRARSASGFGYTNPLLFECVLRLNTPQTSFFMIGCLVVYIF